MQESTSLLDSASLEVLRGKKNLLAFSGGVDSSALFFLLLEVGIEFDIAIVNYHTRESSDAEEAYARELCEKYGKECFVLSANPPQKNFEAEARRIRYEFFEKIIASYGYDNLITAHQLNDRLEWFLMRLAKGAGIVELVGSGGVQKRGGYTIVRPLIRSSRWEIYNYLRSLNIRFFEDDSNADTKYERNFFRKEFASSFMSLFADGVRRSFDILESQAALFESDFFEWDSLIVFRHKNEPVDSSNIALALKKLGYLPSKRQREEILKNYDAVVGSDFAISKNKKGLIFVSPYKTNVKLDKSFKELCRRLDIPPKIRPHLFSSGVDVRRLATALELHFQL